MASASKKCGDFCSSLFLIGFVFSAFIIMFTYTNNLTNVSQSLNYENLILLDFNEPPPSSDVQQYSYECDKRQCVRRLVYGQPVTLHTCQMLCSEPPLWPKPSATQITNKNYSTVDISRINFSFDGQGRVRFMLQSATQIFRNNIELMGQPSTVGCDVEINITLTDWDSYQLKLHTNESYGLKVRNHGIVDVWITAENFFGVRHALETLSQLIWYDGVLNRYQMLHDVDIEDSPKFPYRGVMIDTARNFFPISLLTKIVDGMAASKLNVLHLHLTDSTSFPLVLPGLEKLSLLGSYEPDMTYTPDDVKDLLEYSRVRGVRLLLEVDAPSHVNAGWNAVENYVICGEDDVFNGHLNPDNEGVFNILEEIYRQLIYLTEDDEIFHMGSDEVNLTCWQNTSAAAKYQNDMRAFWTSFTNQMLASLKRANNNSLPENVIVWSSPLTSSDELTKLDTKAVVQFWLGDHRNVLKSGNKIIFSTVGHWYLDCGFGAWRSGKEYGACDPYTSWEKFYKYRPWDLYYRRDLVLGGEVCLWSEQVDVDTLETRVFPRAAAFGERVWSDPVTFAHDVYTRFVGVRERLAARQIRTAATWPRWCSLNPGKC